MSNLKLQNFGVQEMDAKEMIGTDGGFLQILTAIAAVGTAALVFGTIYEAGKMLGKEAYHLHHS